jgi:hypothetical protein
VDEPEPPEPDQVRGSGKDFRQIGPKCETGAPRSTRIKARVLREGRGQWTNRLLIQQAQQGDADAFERLLRRYDERIMGLIMGFVKNRNDAQDVFQEVFLRVWTSLPRFRQESSFFTWVYRIAVNRCISLCEQRNRRDRPACAAPGDGRGGGRQLARPAGPGRRRPRGGGTEDRLERSGAVPAS